MRRPLVALIDEGWVPRPGSSASDAQSRVYICIPTIHVPVVGFQKRNVVGRLFLLLRQQLEALS